MNPIRRPFVDTRELYEYFIREIQNNKEVFFGQRLGITLFCVGNEVVDDSNSVISSNLGNTINFGVVSAGRVEESEERERKVVSSRFVEIQNCTPFPLVVYDLRYLEPLDETDRTIFKFPRMLLKSEIKPQTRVKFRVTLDLDHLPQSTNRFVSSVCIFLYKFGEHYGYFARKMFVSIRPKSDQESFKELSIYAKKFYTREVKNTFGRPPRKVLSGTVPHFPQVFFSGLNEIYKNRMYSEIISRQPHQLQESTTMIEPLMMFNYGTRFQVLLGSEYLAFVRDLSQFNVYFQAFRNPRPNVFTLLVPGVSDRRPPLLIGDVVRARAVKFPDDVENVGFVLDIRGNLLYISFSKEFNTRLKYHVTFDMIHMKECYETMFKNLGRFLRFGQSPPPPQDPRGDPFNDFNLWKNILTPSRELMIREVRRNRERRIFGSIDDVPFVDVQLNHEQKKVVFDVLNQASGRSPYVCFGPPGTGKTRTLTELVLQIVKNKLLGDDERILLLTPSESSADWLGLQMKDYALDHRNEMKILRLNHYRRSKRNMKIQLLQFSLSDNSGYFTIPEDKEELEKYNVIITTNLTVQLLRSIGRFDNNNNNNNSLIYDNNYFNFRYIFMDEAAQAMEVESLIGLSFAKKNTQVAIFGDPRQLGPNIHSMDDLKVSFQERLMRMREYLHDSEHNDGVCCYTMLTKNYRNHGKIIEIPSRLFYGMRLELYCENVSVSRFSLWRNLKNKNDFPLLFVNIQARDFQIGSSWWSPHEASEVLELVQSLIDQYGEELISQIGVITAYRAQVEKIRNLLRQNRLGGIDVGTVLDYQGKEKAITIVSTVRTNLSSKYSQSTELGMVNHPKKMNVALTRAESLLVVVGDVMLLLRDRYWKHFIHFCYSQGNYVGEIPEILKKDCKISFNPLQMEIQGFVSSLFGNSMASSTTSNNNNQDSGEIDSKNIDWRLIM